MGASLRSWREHAASKKLITDPCAVSIADKPVSCILPEHRAATVRNNARPVSARVCALSSRIRRTNAQPGHLELRHGTALALPIRARDTRQGCHRGTGRDAQLRRGVRRATNLARAFTALGLRKGDVLAIQIPNVPEFAIAYFAATMIGAVLAPIYMPYRTAEIAPLLKHARARLAISRLGPR